MPKKVSVLSRSEQPISWSRSIFVGILASWAMMALIDIFYMMGFTHFCLEFWLGSMIRGTIEYAPRSWLVGFFASSFVGGILGILYGYFFEYVFYRSNSRVGTALGFGHAVIAALLIFPFFDAIRGQMNMPIYANFGFFGFGLDWATPILLLFGHMGFGAVMGTFYGPVRAERVRMRDFEPGESGHPGEPEVIEKEQDPEDRSFVGYGH